MNDERWKVTIGVRGEWWHCRNRKAAHNRAAKLRLTTDTPVYVWHGVLRSWGGWSYRIDEELAEPSQVPHPSV